LAGKAECVIAGYYPGIAEAAKQRISDQVEPLDPALLSAEMFVAFLKKSPCRSLSADFGKAIAAMATDGRFSKMLNDAEIAWDNAQQPKK
jgi:polar amino acid transport system substrate-binding protein